MGRIFILGGGPSGLSAAFYLSSHSTHPITLFESAEDIGGLAMNFGEDGWHFEYGPHNIHSQDEGIISFLSEIFSDRLLARQIATALYIFEKQVSYPLKGMDTLTVLSPDKMLMAGWDFFVTRLKAFISGIKDTDHFDEWVIGRFGTVLYELYFAPYVSKVWKIDPHDLSSDVGEKRIPVLRIRELILRQLGLSNRNPHPEDAAIVKSYMPIHGSGKIMEYLGAEAMRNGAELHINATVRRVITNGSRITGLHIQHGNRTNRESNTYHFNEDDLVISTIPLTQLVRLFSPQQEYMLNHSRHLDYTSLVLLYLKIKGGPLFNKSWVYFASTQLIFNRISEYSYDDLEMVPKGHTSLCIEIPCKVNDELWNMPDVELFERVIKQLRIYINVADDSIDGFFKKRIEYGYPRFRVGYHLHLSEIMKCLLSLDNIAIIGRQGLFCYANIDQCMRMAFDMSHAIINNKTTLRDAHQDMHNKFHGAKYSINI